MMATTLRKSKPTLSRKQVREWTTGYLFIMPVILGLLVFTLYPMAMSLYYSFTKFDILSPPHWIGLSNYQRLFADPLFWTSLSVTFRYALISVPLNLILSGLLSILLNQPVKGITIYRTIFYIPVVVPIIVTAMLFKDLYDADFGIINGILNAIGLPGYTWVSRPETALNSLIVMNFWQIGAGTIVWLAGLRSIPQYLYEAARVDGAGVLYRLWHITIPMLTPVIFFNLVLGVIGGLQAFLQSYVLTSGGPDNSTLFIVLNIFNQAFVNFRTGYAAANAWVLFLIIAILTAIIFRTSGWVYYEGGEKR